MLDMVPEEGSPSATSLPLQLFSQMSLSPGFCSPYPWPRELKSEERGLFLIQLLTACANHVAAGNVEKANIGLEHISYLASPNGDTMQRIAAYFAEALADRILKISWPGLHKALYFSKVPSISEEIIVRRLFFDLCPFMKLAYVITNQAITEAMQGEKMVHVIDLHSSEPAQWINLLQKLSARPEGPPHLRITGIHKQKEVLELMAYRLNQEAERLDIPFQFNPVVSKLENIDMQGLRVKTGEALAISSVLQLHSLLAFDDELLRRNTPSTSTQRTFQMNQFTLRDFLEKDATNSYGASPDSSLSSPQSFDSSPNLRSFLNSLRGLSPKLIVVTEQESNHNMHNLMERVTGALKFYAALFDCLESTVSRSSTERQKVEKMLYGEEIKNIIACEGLERKERHEKFEKWIARLDLAGFGRVPLSYLCMLEARRLLQSYGYNECKIKEEKGHFVMCWHDMPLFTTSAWMSKRYS
ncbi:hypothetical protein NMG60_11029537 [Bertholletia excelsa]